MRGKKAKAIRKKIYQNTDFRQRSYQEIPSKTYVFNEGTDKEYKYIKYTTIADKTRRWYQNAKTTYKRINNGTITPSMLVKPE